MIAADHGGPRLDLYQLLGVPLDASRDEIALAWRRRARDEAWQVLGDPTRRAAYDRALARERQPAVRVAEPPLRAGPAAAERLGLAVLADLALRYLTRDRGRPW